MTVPRILESVRLFHFWKIGRKGHANLIPLQLGYFAQQWFCPTPNSSKKGGMFCVFVTQIPCDSREGGGAIWKQEVDRNELNQKSVFFFIPVRWRMFYRYGRCHFRAHPEERCSHKLDELSSVKHLGWLNSTLKNVEDDCDCISYLSPESCIYLWVVYDENKVMVCVSGSSNYHGIELLFLGEKMMSSY